MEHSTPCRRMRSAWHPQMHPQQQAGLSAPGLSVCILLNSNDCWRGRRTRTRGLRRDSSGFEVFVARSAT
jgi:hypothetical protein